VSYRENEIRECACRFVVSLPGTASHQGVSFADGERNIFHFLHESQTFYKSLCNVKSVVYVLVVVNLRTSRQLIVMKKEPF